MLNAVTYRFILAALAAWLLSSCATQPTTPVGTPAVTASAAGYPTDLQGARLYRLAEMQSSLHVLVYRGGSLANLGHNHVLTSASMSGYVWLDRSAERSGFSLVVPVDGFIVDDDAARAVEGDDFPLNVSDDARSGTKRNLLSSALLDGARYPSITLKSVAIADLPMTDSLAVTQATVRVTFDLTLKDQTRRFSIPVTFDSDDQQLRARGEFELKQTDFGIKPYSVAMGALQVQDAVKIKFDLIALPWKQ